MQAFFAHGAPEHFFVGRIKHQEAAAACPNQFTAEGAMGHGVIIPVIDVLIAHAGAADFFSLPMYVHQAGKFFQIVGFECTQRLVAEILGEVQIIEHCLIIGFGLVILILQNTGGASGITGEEKQEIVFEIKEGLFRNFSRSIINPAIFMESESGDATHGGNILILFPDGLAQPVNLNVARLFG